MSQQKLYQYCNYSIMSGITVTMNIGASYHTTWSLYGMIYNGDLNDVTWSIPQAITTDLKVYYSYWSKTNNYGVTTYVGTNTIFTTIPAGSTGITYSIINHETLYGGTPLQDLEQWLSGTTLQNQPSLPVGCTSQPSGCTVGLSGYTITAPTVRGASDGSITLAVTGNTGTTLIWKINGTNVYTGNTPYTFTGLTTGFYTVSAFEGFCFAQVEDIAMPDGQFFTLPFITGSPAQLTAANNPIVFQLQTATNSPNPLPAKSRFRVVGNVLGGTSITISLNYPQVYTATFTAAGFPDSNTKFLASGLTDQNGVNVGYNTDNEIATSIAECLQQDVVIRRLYYITNDNEYVSLTARENTPNLNLTPVQVSINAATISLIVDQYGISAYEGQLTGDYSLYTEVYVNPALEFGGTPVASDYVRVAELQIPYQKDNLHKFQVESVLKNYTKSTPPDFTFTGFTTMPDYDCAYFLKYGEIFPLIANSQTKKKRYKGSTNYLHTCNAALDYEDANDMTGYLGTVLTGLTPSNGVYPRSGVTFLTNSPSTLYVQRDSKQYLSFLLQKNYATTGRTLSCNGTIYFYNGSVTTGVTFFQITSGVTTNFGGLTLLAVGYDALGLANYENSGNTKVRRVDFAVYQTDANGKYSLTDIKTFLYEIDEAPTRYGLAFLNKYGCWDIFDFVGEVVYDEDVTRENYQVPREINANGSSPNGFINNSVYNTQYTPKVTLNSGTIDSSTYEWLQELLQTNRIYSYTNPHQNFMIVDSYTANKSTNVNEFTLQLILRESIGENNISV